MLQKQILRQLRVASKTVRQTRQIQRSPFSSIPSLSPRATVAFPLRIARRWQSTEAEKKPEEQSAASQAKSEEAPKEEDKVKQELDAAKKEIIDLKDKYLRSVADYRNLQERTRRDIDSGRQFAIQRFATDLLDSIDNLDRALGAVPEAALGKSSSSEATVSNASSSDPNQADTSEAAGASNQDLVNLHGGLKMTEQILMQALAKHGLERFDPMQGEGRKFDPNQDEATFFAKQDGKEDGDVFFTQSKGFKLNGRVIRAAKVGVVKNS